MGFVTSKNPSPNLNASLGMEVIWWWRIRSGLGSHHGEFSEIAAGRSLPGTNRREIMLLIASAVQKLTDVEMQSKQTNNADETTANIPHRAV